MNSLAVTVRPELVQVTKFFLPATVEEKILSFVAESASARDQVQHLCHDALEPVPLLVYVCWQSKTANKIGFRFPSLNALASLRFSAGVKDETVCIENVSPVVLVKGSNPKERQHYETQLYCHAVFRSDLCSDSWDIQTLQALLLMAEMMRQNQLEGRTLLNVEYLDAAIAHAKKQSFSFTTADCKVLHRSMLEATLTPADQKKYTEQLLDCAHRARKLSLVVVIKKPKKKSKKYLYYPCAIQRYELEQGVLYLKIDETHPIPDDLLRNLSSRVTFEFNPIGDLTIQRDALKRLRQQTRLPGMLPLDLFLFGENREIVQTIPPITEEDLQIPIQRYLRNDLNEEQKRAVSLALATPDFLLLQGPPGTGKTTFIAELCYQIVQRGGVVLVASQTNLAVDNALSRLAEHADILAARIGNVRKMHEIGLEFVEGSAATRWLSSLVDKIKGELDVLHYYFDLHPLFIDHWSDICLHYEVFARKQEIDCAALQEEIRQIEQQCQLLQMKQEQIKLLFQMERQENDLLQQISPTARKIVQHMQSIDLLAHGEIHDLRVVFHSLDHHWLGRLRAWEQCVHDGHFQEAELLLKNMRVSFHAWPLFFALPLLGAVARYRREHMEKALLKQKAYLSHELTYFGQAVDGLGWQIRQECAEELARIEQIMQIAQSRMQELQQLISYGDAQHALHILQMYWQRYYALIPPDAQKTLHWHEEGIPYYEDILKLRIAWARALGSDWDIRTLGQRISILEDWLATLQTQSVEVPRNVWEMFLQNANVYGTTCVHSGTYNFLNTITNIRKKGFDYVIIDEVSKASANELLIPCLFGKKIILVGDHKQLPPLVHTEMQAQLQELAEKYASNEEEIDVNLGVIKRHFFSAFFAERFEYLSQHAPHYQRTVMLKKQYRMHSQIMDAINQFYDQELIQGCCDQEREHYLKNCWWLPNGEAHLAWIDTGTNKHWIHHQEGESRVNRAEAHLMIGILKDIIEKYMALFASDECPLQILEIGVISVYRAQTNLLQLLFEQTKKEMLVPENILVEFGTVDAFQGREQDIILLSLVLNNKDTVPSEFLADPRRINVAMSRARRLLLIFGSTHNYTKLKGSAAAKGDSRRFYQKILSIAKFYRSHVGVRLSLSGEEK